MRKNIARQPLQTVANFSGYAGLRRQDSQKRLASQQNPRASEGHIESQSGTLAGFARGIEKRVHRHSIGEKISSCLGDESLYGMDADGAVKERAASDRFGSDVQFRVVESLVVRYFAHRSLGPGVRQREEFSIAGVAGQAVQAVGDATGPVVQ